MTQTWIVRAGRDDEFLREDLDEGVVAVGWRRLGDLTDHRTMQAIKPLIEQAYREVSPRSRVEFLAQLVAFRSRMRTGDYVILLRSNASDVAIGTVTGDYAHRPSLAAGHVRPVAWARTDVAQREIGADLLEAPALTSIYKVNKTGAEERIKALLAARAGTATAPPPPTPTGAMGNFNRNIAYARDLATAGHHLEQLKVGSFEISDVYRAAWVQCVSSLDHWVHQELRERMLPASTFPFPAALAKEVEAGTMTADEAFEKHFKKTFGGRTFQQPNRIQEAFDHVADVTGLWPKVAAVLTERAGGESYSAATVQDRLREVVNRRNKIAHEYDEDPDNPPNKRPITEADTTKAIRLIEQVAEAIVAVLDGK
jgi:hypothetical protein